MMSVSKTIALPGGGEMPTLGLGTWTAWKAAPGTVRDAVKIAIAEGYRLLDCAWLYENEAEIGDAIEAKIKDGTIRREDMFVTTKEGPEKFPVDGNGKSLYEYHDLLDTWKGMEDAVDAGLVRNIGISNFNSKQVQNILDNARIKPATNQIEVHPYLSSVKLVEFCQDRRVTITAYAPFYNPTRPWTTNNDLLVLEDPVIKNIAVTNRKTPAQVILRFLLQRGLIVIPKSVTPARIRENFQVFDFELSKEDMEKMLALDKNLRAFEYFAQDHFADHPEYPFNAPF